MSPDLQALEAKLTGLRPAALEGMLLARLEDSADGTLTMPLPGAAEFEDSLRQRHPAQLPPALMAALAATLGDPATTASATIIPFPKAAPVPAVRTRHGNRSMLAAAAAVALLGAAAAWFVPAKAPRQSVAAPITRPPQAPPFATTPAAPELQDFVPDEIKSGLSQASDEGVLWQPNEQPRRVVKVVYWDRVTFVNPEGKKIECETPRIEYILVPENID
ncbi:MAG: hypothetical protein NTW21_26630 [Verrucomicrobia bacterium]|nr:hypothetical protein [Verrucomicrobiota bacterium]